MSFSALFLSPRHSVAARILGRLAGPSASQQHHHHGHHSSF
ncbi:hypothetical protein [Hymenobacter sp. HSC-4F20]|nr:hypothetical protein [Hymenobacter sp. HSC-4F20]